MYSRTEHRDKMAHAHYMLRTQVYRHTLRVCINYCSSTATMVARTRLIVRLYIHCLYCSRLDLRVDALDTDNQARRKHDGCICLQFLACFPIARYLKFE